VLPTKDLQTSGGFIQWDYYKLQCKWKTTKS